jgi:AcrR family transcriptional regulator
MSDIARVAGVQRHTLYRHFPDERSIGFACSGLHMELNPPPDPAAWRTIAGAEERLRRGLWELYSWFARNEDMFSKVLRDAEVDPFIGEMFALRAGESMALIRETLAEPLQQRARVQATLDLALDFHAWRRLARSGLSPEEAAGTMVAAIRCQ